MTPDEADEIEHASSGMDETSPLLPDSDPLLSQPLTDTSEVWLLLQYSLPLIATYLLQYSYTVVTTIVAGHLSADDLAATSIGLTTANIIGYAVYEGMATALDTLCSQAYGSGNLIGVGLHVQRMLVLMVLATIPIGSFYICSPWILSSLVKQPHLAAKAGMFLRMSVIGLPGYASFEALKRFLQAQGDCNAGLAVLIICTPVNALLSWVLAFKMGWGLEGAALGAALANNLRPTLLVLYVVIFGKWSHQCWGGFSREALRNWGPMVRLSTAGTIVNLGEWCALEVATFSTSYISTEHLAAQAILTTLTTVTWHIPFSVGVAMSIRIGHLIGAGLVVAARRAAALYASVFALIGLFDASIIFLLRYDLPGMISDDSLVKETASKAMASVAAYQLIDAMSCGASGMLRGLGRQAIGAWVVIPVNYLGSLPLAIWLELGSPGLKLNGVWIGLGIGIVITTSIECIYMKVMNWQDCVDSAKSREEMS